MKFGSILIFFAQALNAFSAVRNVVGGAGSVGEQQERLFAIRLFVQDLHSGVACLCVSTTRKKDLAKFKLYFRIVRLQFCGSLEHRIGLTSLPLLHIKEAQLAQRRRILRSEPK